MMNKSVTALIVVCLLTACAIPSQPVNIDRSVLEDIPPEAALAWLQKAPRNMIGLRPSFFSACDFSNKNGVLVNNMLVPWKNMKVEAVQRLKDSGIISLIVSNANTLSNAFSNKDSCYAYREYLVQHPIEPTSTEKIRLDMNKTLSALGALGVELDELPE